MSPFSDRIAPRWFRASGAEKEMLMQVRRSAAPRLGLGVAALSTIALLTLAGCMVGPNFKRPAPPPDNSYATPVKSMAAVSNVTGGAEQRFVQGLEISAQWWNVFHSKALDNLIDRSLTNNADLGAARAALRVAHENTLAQKGAYYPHVSASFSGSRQRQSDLLAPTPNANVFEYNLFTPQLNISYVPDVFGLNRRTVEASKAQEQ